MGCGSSLDQPTGIKHPNHNNNNNNNNDKGVQLTKQKSGSAATFNNTASSSSTRNSLTPTKSSKSTRSLRSYGSVSAFQPLVIDASSEMKIIHPIVGFVVKITGVNEKVFIDVYFHHEVITSYVDPNRSECFDRKGLPSALYHVIMNEKKSTPRSDASLIRLAEESILVVNAAFKESYPRKSFTLPSIAKGYMGSEPHVFNIPEEYFKELPVETKAVPSPPRVTSNNVGKSTSLMLFGFMGDEGQSFDSDAENASPPRPPIDHATIMRNHAIVQDVKKTGVLVGEEVAAATIHNIEELTIQSHSQHSSPSASHRQSVHYLHRGFHQAALAAAQENSHQPLELPQDARFWALKKSRTDSIMKPRFFVLHAGLLSYYLESSNEPPFGKEFKGAIFLSGFEFSQLSPQPSNHLLTIILDKDNTDDVVEFQFGLRSQKRDADEAILQHIEFATAIDTNKSSRLALAQLAQANSPSSPTSPVASYSGISATPSSSLSEPVIRTPPELFSEDIVLFETSDAADETPSRELFPAHPPLTDDDVFSRGQKSDSVVIQNEPSSTAESLRNESPNRTMETSSDVADAQKTSDDSVQPTILEGNSPFLANNNQSPAASLVPRSVEPTDPVETLRDVPAQLKFWAQKKGHVNVSPRPRFFVLSQGFLSYFLEEQGPLPPHGKDFRGCIHLAGYDFVDLSFSGEMLYEMRILIRNQADETKEFDMNFVDLGLVRTVSNALFKHIRYANACQIVDAEAARASASVPSPVASVATTPTPKIEKQTSRFGGFFGRTSSSSSVNASNIRPYFVSKEQLGRWSLFVPSGLSLVATALVNKPNPVGKTHMRQIILLSNGELLYLDPTDFSLKGTIITRNDSNPNCRAVSENSTTFTVRDVTSGRDYKFLDTNFGSDFWVSAISSLLI